MFITREYPDLQSEDIHQALAYAAVLANEEIHLFPGSAAMAEGAG